MRADCVSLILIYLRPIVKKGFNNCLYLIGKVLVMKFNLENIADYW